MIATVTLNPSLDEWIELPALRLGALNRAGGFLRYAGGKGINVSRVLHELGERTVAFAPAGGEDGLILRELMNRMRLPHDFVTVRGLTRNNYKIRTSHPRTLTEINTAGPRVSRQILSSLFQRLLTRVPRPECVALCGSLPPGAPPTLYQQWIRVLRRLRIPTALDTSGPALRHGLAARPWLIKPNRQEAEDLLERRFTHPHHLVQAVHQLLRRGPEIVILSLGKAGALFSSRFIGEVWRAHPPAVNVDSAVGAGDALVGGFLVGWATRQSLLESFRLGVACGTAAAMTPGTELCHRAEVRRLFRRVRMRRVA